MRALSSVLLACLLAFTTYAEDTAPPQAEVQNPDEAEGTLPANLVTNGDFELVNGDGTPVGWDRFKKHFAEVAEEDGNKFLRITSAKMGSQPMTTQKFDVPPGTQKVWVSVRMRTANTKVGEKPYENPRVQMTHYDAEGELLGYGPSPKVTEDTDWKTIAFWYPLKDGAAKIGVGCGVQQLDGCRRLRRPGRVAEGPRRGSQCRPEGGSQTRRSEGSVGACRRCRAEAGFARIAGADRGVDRAGRG